MILERLAAVDRARPVFDPGRAEAALAAHFRALGLTPFRVEWTVDADRIRAAVPSHRQDERWIRLESSAWSEAEAAASWGFNNCGEHEQRQQIWHDGLSVIEGHVREAAWRKAWTPHEDLALGLWVEQLRQADRRNMTLVETVTWNRTAYLRMLLDWETTVRASRARFWRSLRRVGVEAARCTAEAAAWTAAAEQGKHPSITRYRDLWTPFVDAFEAGLWVFWIFEDFVLAVPRPAIRTKENRLHSEDGPALAWPEGRRFWFWKGVQVSHPGIEHPELITEGDITHERNVEVRRALLDRFGLGRYLAETGARPIHSDRFGTLYRLRPPDDEPIVLVKVVNATPNPDGTRSEYFLRVPPNIDTAREAVAWTFGMAAHEYAPESET